jgi:myo-inositol-1(or 4)-monophosphatase
MRALERRFDTALRLTSEAGALALRMWADGGPSGATLKGAQDWLTEADGAVERFLSERLAALFPLDGFQGEEGGKARQGALRWVADPIDGTANYARGRPRFCVSLALLEGRTPLIGVVVAPALGEIFSAQRDAGARCNGRPMRAAETRDLSRALVECGWSNRRPVGSFTTLVERLVEAGAAPRLLGAGALGLTDVAAGRSDAYVELHINLWDVAAALVVLREAGAFVSPFLDGDGPEHGNPILACAPHLADSLRSVTGI